MPDHRKLFAVTQWVLRAGIIVTMLLIGMFVLGEAATIFAAPRACRSIRSRAGRASR